jgi:hypothetical protein
LLSRDWVALWEREERFQHGRHGAAAPLSNALKAAQHPNGASQHRVRPLTYTTGIPGQTALVGLPAEAVAAKALVQVDWALGSPGASLASLPQ